MGEDIVERRGGGGEEGRLRLIHPKQLFFFFASYSNSLFSF